MVSDELGSFSIGDQVLVRFGPNKDNYNLGILVNVGTDSADAYVFMGRATHPIMFRGIIHEDDRRIREGEISVSRGVFKRLRTMRETAMEDLVRRVAQLEMLMKRGKMELKNATS